MQNHVFWKICVWNPSWPDLGPIWGQLDAQNGSKMASKIDQKTNKRTTRKKNTKRKKKEAQESVKSRHAGHLWVVGASLHLTQLWTESGVCKRFSLYKIVLVCIWPFYFIKRYLFENTSYWPFLAALGLLLAQFCSLLGRFWPHLAALGRPRGDTHAHFQTPEDTYTHTRNDIQK